MTKRTADKPRQEHYFFLNPYQDFAFSKCPKCGRPTKLRKFPLAVHIEPRQLFVLNKSCRYCERCDLIIAKQSEVESLMAAAFERRQPEIVGNEYLVFGVLERKDWRESTKSRWSDAEVVERVIVFRDVLHFKIVGGWTLDPAAQRSRK